MRSQNILKFSLFLSLIFFPTQGLGQPVSAESDSFSVPGAPPNGAITDGVLLRPQGTNQLEIISIRPEVTRIRIEQSDFLVPATGPNTNRLFIDGVPINLVGRVIDLTNVHSVRFTVQVSGDLRVPQAVGFRWVLPRYQR